MDSEKSQPYEPADNSRDKVFNTPGVDEFLSAYYAFRHKFGKYVTNATAPHSTYSKRHEQEFDEWDQAFNEAAQVEAPRDTPPAPQDKADIAKIINQIIEANAQASWLQNIPQTDVLAVVNTVRVLRSKGMDDWQIYKKYRLKAETNPALTQKVQILDAFVAGNVGKQMKLPF